MCLIAKASREVFGGPGMGEGVTQECLGRGYGVGWYSRVEADLIRVIVDEPETWCGVQHCCSAVFSGIGYCLPQPSLAGASGCVRI